MIIGALSTYRPCWLRGERRVCGSDEDVLTMAVAAAGALVEAGVAVRRLVLVTHAPTQLRGDAAEVLAEALRLDAGVPVEVRVGGGPEVLDALTSVPEGTVVIGVDGAEAADAAAGPDTAGAAAGAALVGAQAGSGTVVVPAGVVRHSLPLVVDHPHDPAPRRYADPRLLRERGWRPAIAALSGDRGPVLVVGAPASLGPVAVDRALSSAIDAGGAAAPLLAIDALHAAGAEGRVIAVEGASARSVDVGPHGTVLRVADERPGRPEPPVTVDRSVEIPISLAGYERAFPARVGLKAGRCACGHLECPPRHRCLVCGREGEWALVPLPRGATVYSVVTVRVPVPGLETPYSLAIVDVEGTEVRLLVRVTGAEPGAVGIGARGTLVLRKVATRQGVDDYGYAFQPDDDAIRRERAALPDARKEPA